MMRGAFIVKTDSKTTDVGVELNGRAIFTTAHAPGGTTRAEQDRVIRDVELQLEEWRLCGVPRCILIHNGRKVGELLAAS